MDKKVLYIDWFNELNIEVWWRLYASVNWTSLVEVNAWYPIGDNADLSIGSSVINFSERFIKSRKVSVMENHLKSCLWIGDHF